jgi:hypothetical protein
MDLSSHQNGAAILIFLRISELHSKTTAGSPKGAEIDPTCPTLTKVLLQGSTRILIYIDGLFFSHQLFQSQLLSYLLPFS